MSLYGSIFTNDTSTSASFRATPTLRTWNQIITVNGYTPSGTGADDGSQVHFPNDAFFNLQEIPNIGDAHPTAKDSYCTNVSVEPFSENDPVNLRAVITWAAAGGFASCDFDVFSQTDVRNFTFDHILCEVNFTPPNGQSAGTNDSVPHIASVRVPKLIQSLRITQYEALPTILPGLIMDTSDPIWNSDDRFLGFAAGTLLYIGVKSSSDGTPLYRRTYTFLYNPLSRGGWHHFFAVYVGANGLIPKGLGVIDPSTITTDVVNVIKKTDTGFVNGNAVYKMLGSDDFSTLLLPRLRPPFGKNQ